MKYLARIVCFLISVYLFGLSSSINANLIETWTVPAGMKNSHSAAGVDNEGNTYGVNHYHASVDNYDLHIWKLDSDGNFIFVDTFDNANDGVYKIISDINGNITVAGNTFIPFTSPNTSVLLRYDNTGNRTWTKFHSNPGGYSYTLNDKFDINLSGNIASTGIVSNTNPCEVSCQSIHAFGYFNYDPNPTWQFTHDQCMDRANNPVQIALNENSETYYVYKTHLMDECVTDCSYIDGCTTTITTHLVKLGANGQQIWEKNLAIDPVRLTFDNNDFLILAANTNPLDLNANVIEKYGTGTATDWTIPLDYYPGKILVDRNNDLIVIGMYYPPNTKSGASAPSIYYLAKYSGQSGSQIWRKTLSIAGSSAIGVDDKIFVAGYVPGTYPNRETHIVCYAPDGTLLFDEFTGINKPFAFIGEGVDYSNALYLTDSYFSTVTKYLTSKTITLYDAEYNPLTNTEVELIQVSDDPPYFTEDTLGFITTDSEGNIPIDAFAVDSFTVMHSNGSTQLAVNDILKFAIHVHTEPALKHASLLGSAYTIHLDNAHFSETGVMSFDSLNASAVQEIILNHTEYRFNLLVSVEWDTDNSYQWDLRAAFLNMTNYLYDITDGQMRFDTILIFDDADHWLEADMRIYASNDEHPRASLAGLFSPQINQKISMPRKWYGNAEHSHDSTYIEIPIDPNTSDNLRTTVHEFGHYGLGFYDEYLFYIGLDGSGNRLFASGQNRCAEIQVYGFMDSQYERNDQWDVLTTEMSHAALYLNPDCANTEHYIKRNNKSCWDYLESWAEGNRGANNIFVPMFKPDDIEHLPPDNTTYFPGPNDNLIFPDYDVGFMLQFPQPVLPPSPDNFTVEVEITEPFGGTIIDGARVSLVKPAPSGGSFEIPQGKTGDQGRIYVLGASNGDEIRSAFKIDTLSITKQTASTEVWLTGTHSVDSDMPAMITLSPVNGYFPAICQINADTLEALFTLETSQSFPIIPTVEISEKDSLYMTGDMSTDASGYIYIVPERLQNEGHLTITSEDNASNSFFFPISYNTKEYKSNDSVKDLLGAGGQSEILFDYDNTNLLKSTITSSSYPVPRIGLNARSQQAGETHCLDVYPNNALSGSALVKIRYSDSDISTTGDVFGLETSLRVFRWEGLGIGWILHGGSVDTVSHEIITTVDSPGVYAVFTTDAAVGIDENTNGTLIPESYQLYQNYPNPFNPVTEISFAVPSASNVKLEVYNIIGQKVATLADGYYDAGSHIVRWDATNMASGMYLYRIEAGDFIDERKMVLVK